MSPVSLLLNVLWILCGGLWMAAGWVLAALIMAITIVGLPWSFAALTMNKDLGFTASISAARTSAPGRSA